MRSPLAVLALAAVLGAALAPAPAHAADPPQRLIVHFDALPPGLRERGTYAGAPVVAVDGTLGFAVVEAPHAGAFRAAARDRPEVRAVEPDGVAHSLGFTPNDPLFSSQYALQAIGAPAAWATTLGAGVTLCLLDTGVRHTHEDLRDRYAGGIDLVNGDNDPWDDGGHGTRTAGVAAATIGNGRGIAGVANAFLKEVKVLDAGGRGYDSNVAIGIRWCADNGADVVSISLGSPMPNAAVQAAVDYAWGKGLLLVAGAGNGGCSDCVLYPAAYPNVVAVGCVDPAGAVCASTSRGPQVDLAAPGSNIRTTGFGADNAYVYGGGTSLSAPHVAGAAALVWSAHPSFTNAQVRQALESTARDLGPAGRDPASGAGLVRADRAVAYGTPAPPPPAFSASFTPSPNVNAWWVDVKVTSTGTVAGVSAAVNGGAPKALAKTSWGTWAASFHAPKGSTLVFTAKDPSGATATSAPVAWLMPTGTTPAPAPSLTATFTPKTLTNHWWVEASVSASQPLAKVEARLNDGAWTALPKTSWGTYAKSLSVPAGTQIVFRATSTTGATAMSGVFTER